MLAATLRAFHLDVNPTHTALLMQLYQSCALEWVRLQRRMLRAPAVPEDAYTVSEPRPLGYQTIVCTWCANADAREFIHTYEDGDIVCRKCGRVTVSNCLFEGETTRTFASESGTDDAAPRPHAAFPDPRQYLFSDEYALRGCPARSASTGADDDVSHAQGKLAYTSDAALPRGQTTTWCKDTDKQQCIMLMEDAAYKLALCRHAVDGAIELFAHVRDARQRVTHKRIIMAACLLLCSAAVAWSRAFPKAVITSHAYDLTCTDCTGVFHTSIARANHVCPKRLVRKRKVHELDMLSFL